MGKIMDWLMLSNLAMSRFKNLERLEMPFVPGSKLPLFSYSRDGHQPNSRALYTHEIRVPVIKGGRSPIPNIRS